MSDSDDRPDLPEAVLDLAEEIQDAADDGQIFIPGGRAHVSLLIPVSATTPEDAVTAFRRTVLSEGLEHLAYLVRDEESGESWVVDGGRVFTAEQAEVELEGGHGGAG